ncbi:cell envelope integrity protein TolA [Urechidicola vernalis]|uniref:Cell envelope integrity protein TolA n=1 Tax=Urechidicola vernalis TaxID=3075600 RepID=A0ABU2Y353_9FLAO|nr:cell envelope integrity protein TolA [Urechidicola sp. P050]MDT0552639.1 cell envelope integrity protein TolA [Urechidicola sp. P050]
MEFLDTVHKRKSATVTSIIMVLLLLLIFFFGMTYMDPPIESGIAVNFGTSEVGSGNIQPKEPVKTEVNPVVEEAPEEVKEEVVEEEVEEAAPVEETQVEEVLTQDSEESILMKQKEDERKKLEEDRLAQEEADRLVQEEADRIKKAQEEADRIAKEEADRIAQEEADKKAKLDAQMSGLINSEGVKAGGEGNDNVGGDKGKVTGDLNASGYSGNGGSGGDGNYQLGGRRPLERPTPVYECEEEGLVVVTIEVNRAGKVIKATPGIKGSTNTAACLLSRAKEAALKTTWEPDENAGVKQIGIIKYRFSLAN